MTIFARAERVIQTFRWYHITLLKLSVFAFTLMLAKLWPPLLSWDWSVYLILSVLFALPLWVRFFRTGN